MFCDNCGTIEPIGDQGTVHIRPAFAQLTLLLQNSGHAVKKTPEGCSVAYSGREEMFSLVQLMKCLSSSVRQQLFFCITGKGVPLDRRKWIPLHLFEERSKHYDVFNIILGKHFTSFMQPIVNRDETVIAYEFLLRPRQNGPSFQPHKLFEAARLIGLHSILDRAARISAIEASALWLPKGIKRFVNFLPSSIYNPEYCLTHTLDAIQRLSLDPADFVFEVVETEEVDDVKHLQAIFEVYRRNGISVAMDDVGAGYSTLEQMIRLKPDYVKIDRSLIDRCDENPEQQQFLLTIANTAREFGACVLAEGIERRQEFEFCCSIGVELAQGYLFGKPAERPLDYARKSAGS
ncbi:EAL domain-containing protein [Paenibacillus sp. DMB20]|uniref:EAL domain-containing protein n=1 Tax=Paenibacillus sp. DMB20 TaxID=1642570 RepID=UPI00062790EC|nr:EAL domain-containing protein [Paenibacillus sp. DMB20]KKO55233.1 hypothetical protein XI25_02490 [Paenibacillus sp. DMB20]